MTHTLLHVDVANRCTLPTFHIMKAPKTIPYKLHAIKTTETDNP
jgi:hypothetical protein